MSNSLLTSVQPWRRFYHPNNGSSCMVDGAHYHRQHLVLSLLCLLPRPATPCTYFAFDTNQPLAREAQCEAI
jgi:hypothetical protein